MYLKPPVSLRGGWVYRSYLGSWMPCLWLYSQCELHKKSKQWYVRGRPRVRLPTWPVLKGCSWRGGLTPGLSVQRRYLAIIQSFPSELLLIMSQMSYKLRVRFCEDNRRINIHLPWCLVQGEEVSDKHKDFEALENAMIGMRQQPGLLCATFPIGENNEDQKGKQGLESLTKKD